MAIEENKNMVTIGYGVGKAMKCSIKISVDSASDVIDALKLKDMEFRFRITNIDLEAIECSALSKPERDSWDKLAWEAWTHNGYINEEE